MTTVKWINLTLALLFLRILPVAQSIDFGHINEYGLLNFEIPAGRSNVFANESISFFLSHVNEFDPSFSKLKSGWNILALKSSVLRLPGNKFLWHKFGENEPLILPAEGSEDYATAYEGNRLKIHEHKSHLVFHYVDGQLVSIRAGKRLLQVESNNGYVAKLFEIIGNREVVWLQVKFNEYGKIQEFHTSPFRSFFKYDSSSRLIEVKVLAGEHLDVYDIQYSESNLVSQVELNKKIKQEFEWMKVDQMTDKTLSQPDYLPPVRLSSDSEYSYRSGINKDGMNLIRMKELGTGNLSSSHTKSCRHKDFVLFRDSYYFCRNKSVVGIILSGLVETVSNLFNSSSVKARLRCCFS